MTPEEAREWFATHREDAELAFKAMSTMLRAGDVEALVELTTDKADISRRAQQAAQRPTEPPFDGKPCPACPSIFRGLHATAHNAVGAFEAAAKGHGDWSRAYRKMAELKEVIEQNQPFVDQHFADPKHSHGWMT